ncbi:MAG: porin family protein [Candidatus Kapaibacterium sp.]
MKKLLVFFFLGFLAVPTIAVAQQMMIGARGGVNFANQQVDQNYNMGESFSIRLGLLAGGQFDYLIGQTTALSAQLLFDQKGTHSELERPINGIYFGPEPTVVVADWTASYLEIPILMKLYSSTLSPRFYVFAGPSIGFLLSNTEKVSNGGYYSYPGNSYGPGTTVNITDSTAKIDLSIVVGVGFSTTLSSGLQLFLDASYAYGLINNDNYKSDQQNGISVYSRDIRLAAGVLFPIQ